MARQFEALAGRVKVRITERARAEIADALQTSFEQFGGDAMLRYEALIGQALADLQQGASPIGSRAIGTSGVRAYHIRNSRRRTDAGVVGNPRHLLIYREAAPESIIVLRLLHDAMNVDQAIA